MNAVLVIDWRAVWEQNQRRHPLNTSHTDQWNDAECEFHAAIADYKAATRRLFPAWSEILDIVLALGYAKQPSAARYHPAGPPRRRGQQPKAEPIPFPRQSRGRANPVATAPPLSIPDVRNSVPR